MATRSPAQRIALGIAGIGLFALIFLLKWKLARSVGTAALILGAIVFATGTTSKASATTVLNGQVEY